MKTSICTEDSFKPSLVYEIAARSANSREITEKDRGVLKTAFLANPLNEEEHLLVNRLYRAIRRGYIKLV